MKHVHRKRILVALSMSLATIWSTGEAKAQCSVDCPQLTHHWSFPSLNNNANFWLYIGMSCGGSSCVPTTCVCGRARRKSPRALIIAAPRCCARQTFRRCSPARTDCCIEAARASNPNKKKMCISRSDNFSMPMAGRAERCSGRDSSVF